MYTPTTTLSFVNDRINQLVKPIIEPKGEDYWQTPSETLLHLTGDCEDYAIAKLYFLLHTHHDPAQLTLRAVRLKGQYHGQAQGTLINHALIVYQDWVLDNYAREITSLSARIDIAQTYAVISPLAPNNYLPWNQMLGRRLPALEAQLFDNLLIGSVV